MGLDHLQGCRVKIHYNLNRCRVSRPATSREACWTVHHAGKVVGYLKDATLVDVRLAVQAGGAGRIRAEHRRRVVAWASGVLVPDSELESPHPLTWNPYRDGNHFVVLAEGERIPVVAAVVVRFQGRHAQAGHFITAAH